MSSPFIEKHLHLSGAVPSDILWEVVVESGVKLPTRTFAEFDRLMTMGSKGSLDKYLEVLHSIDVLQSSPRAVELSTFHAFKCAALSGVQVMELRFNPVKRSRKGRIDLDAIIRSALSGMNRASSIYGVKGSLAFCMGTDCTDPENEAILSKALQYQGPNEVNAIDLAGPYLDTAAYHRFEPLFKKARTRGLSITCHAGEVHSPSVGQTLEYILSTIRPDRIGHGIRILKYPDLVSIARDRGVLFEVCPSSNLASGAVPNVSAMWNIVKNFQNQHLRFQLCTDASASLKTTVAKEHMFITGPITVVQKAFEPKDASV
jgi:adenosine deaminase